MSYDLESIENTCSIFKLSHSRISEYELHVDIAPDSVLIFANAEEGDDTYLGFLGTPAHGHDSIILTTGDATYKEYEPSELLVDLLSGKVLIATTYVKGEKTDKWLVHQDEKLDVRYFQPEEELRIYRLPNLETDDPSADVKSTKSGND